MWKINFYMQLDEVGSDESELRKNILLLNVMMQKRFKTFWNKQM